MSSHSYFDDEGILPHLKNHVAERPTCCGVWRRHGERYFVDGHPFICLMAALISKPHDLCTRVSREMTPVSEVPTGGWQFEQSQQDFVNHMLAENERLEMWERELTEDGLAVPRLPRSGGIAASFFEDEDIPDDLEHEEYQDEWPQPMPEHFDGIAETDYRILPDDDADDEENSADT